MTDYERIVPERGEEPKAKPDPSAYWKTHLLRRLPTPKWETRARDFPLLADPTLLSHCALLDFGGTAKREMATFAYETRPGSSAKFIGVAVPKGARPTAYLIYFRHTAKA